MTVANVDALSRLRVLFGHQSVGANIVEGVRAILAEHGHGQWIVTDITRTWDDAARGLLSVPIGRNGDPLSKTAHFEQLVTGGLGERLDVALHKYCYVDIDGATDIVALFGAYRQLMTRLVARWPHVTFLHVTVPLQRAPRGIHASIRRAVGVPRRESANNARREQFNDLLRGEYGTRRALFDLAALQAAPGTARALREDYTDDGGHLNGLGRRRIATAFLETLAGLSAASCRT